jgi:hypothetical protein
VLNRYEFISAGLRNGDIDERLIMDSERSAIVQLYGAAKEYIWSQRNDRSRMSLYEHLEWLHVRWTDTTPRRIGRCWEGISGRPIPGRRHSHRKPWLVTGRARP